MSSESQRLLDSVPDTIGGAGDPGQADPAGLAVTLQAVTFKEKDVASVLSMICGGLGWLFGSDHWELTPEEAESGAAPLAEMLNYFWLRNRDDLSNAILKWVMDTPGALGLLFWGGFVLAPRAGRQLVLFRDRKRPAPVRVTVGAQPEAPRRTVARSPDIPPQGVTIGGANV